MKFPSLIKVPRYKTFDYQPIYYDAEKAEREQRLKEIMNQNEDKKEFDGNHSYRLNKVFEQNRKHKANNIGVIQGLLIIFLVLVAVVYWYWGSVAKWVFFAGVTGVYVWFRRQKILERQKDTSKK